MRGSLRQINFAGILEELIAWSQFHGSQLEVREPGDQNTVSFGLSKSDDVLWAAYPRNDDGAKIVILPKLFGRIQDDERSFLLEQLAKIAPKIVIRGTGLLQFPLHTLALEDALQAAKAMLESALVIATRYRKGAV